MKKKFSILGLLLFAMAILFGASANISMAMADGLLEHPDAQTPSASEIPGVNSNLQGSPASATVINESDIRAREMDKEIVDIVPYQFSVHNDIIRLAKRVTVTKFEIEHPISAATPMDCQILDPANTGDGTETYIDLVVGTHITKENLKMFAPSSTVVARGYDGYERKELQNPATKGILTFIVTERTKTKCSLTPINGKWNATDQAYNLIPEQIVRGTTFSIMATACSESQLEVAPDAYVPTTRTVYLQKKITNIVMTDDFKKQVKEIPFLEKDLRNHAMYNHRRKDERSLWLGAMSKSRVYVNDKMGWEDVYTAEGIMPQVLNKFALSGDTSTFRELIDICRIQFGKNSMRDEAEAYCGMGFMTRLMNIDFDKTGDVSVVVNRDKYGIMVSEFQCSFGTLHFKKTPALDDLGYSDCCVIVDMENAVRYVKVDNQNVNVDMKKGGGPNGEVREATRDIFVEADALCLRGFNSMLVGPADVIFNYKTINENIESISVLDDDTKNLNPVPTDINGSIFYGGTIPLPFDGDIWYLKVADTFSHFKAGTLVQYNASTGGWEKYSGSITV